MTELADREARAFRILVVDDNRDVADSLTTLVRLWGYDVQVAYDGLAAIQTARNYRPDCILTDIGLPGIDGYQLAALVRQEESLRGTTLIAISAWLDAERVRTAGFDRHIVKPADPVLLEGLVRELHMRKRLDRVEESVTQQGEVVTEVRVLMKEVREDVKEMKEGLQQDVKELKEELNEVKEEVKEIKEEMQEEKQE